MVQRYKKGVNNQGIGLEILVPDIRRIIEKNAFLNENLYKTAQKGLFVQIKLFNIVADAGLKAETAQAFLPFRFDDDHDTNLTCYPIVLATLLVLVDIVDSVQQKVGCLYPEGHTPSGVHLSLLPAQYLRGDYRLAGKLHS